MEKAWWKEAVVYQIYPRSFQDSNGDGIGDLPGITSHLGYIRELGADVVWLCPIYQSPNDDNGYDISDYRSIMSEFGTMADFDELLKAAHNLGLKIVMDLVVNHTSDEHAWFAESRKSKDNTYSDYYIWRDGKDGKEPNNWGSYFSGSAWQYDEGRGQYYLHFFSPKQPDLNWDNPAVRGSVFDMMTWWLQKGIDGFRMDVISMISKQPGLLDGEVAPGALYGDGNVFTNNGPHVHEYLREMNRKVLSQFDIMTVGETPGVTVEEAKKYAGLHTGELNMVFQFEHVDHQGPYGKWNDDPLDLPKLKDILFRWQTGLDGVAWNSLFWDNHDQPRAVSRFGNDSKEWRERSAKMIATALHMLQGTPYVYQGEELGMTNVPFRTLEEYRDIETRNAYDELVHKRGLSHEQMMRFLHRISRDNARTPMQWDDGANAGFTSGTPWIGVNPNYTEINAKAQVGDPDSVFSYYQELIALRHSHEIIVYGSVEPWLEQDEHIFAYRRILRDETLLVLCNFSDQMLTVPLPDGCADTPAQLIGNYDDAAPTAALRPYEARVYLYKQ
ncbi:glycoside hydrolase family 13 protein [Ethanoligenens harbinense]|uniref:Alpha amylase catalytic region n=1 Tax=Ethanoligenens harbinense (strain DSM 18485 / JCM 12961 / CGMCC 1.5033 / YUAN-3) TaxID=663278 RepID=E6U2M6_ETHHY|nr:alpha-glucosidase [Ethanoligenens harbinense]ADU26317.1 alpha amylase catalytic region [Ethanoligenens harbinense YUAN-3]AVQ95450.1 alpha-glucosidase [Ethanoligenens harbinense YUAN-3]AYF38115.1 alpha-glucosidase [Ethanoligenens harbinense]AYF40860.1 alpha-glucosidase [Ethanoligenens harbinense]QCN91690.1 alpha-glucosidase [Ethanoligenens harbinense]